MILESCDMVRSYFCIISMMKTDSSVLMGMSRKMCKWRVMESIILRGTLRRTKRRRSTRMISRIVCSRFSRKLSIRKRPRSSRKSRRTERRNSEKKTRMKSLKKNYRCLISLNLLKRIRMTSLGMIRRMQTIIIIRDRHKEHRFLKMTKKIKMHCWRRFTSISWLCRMSLNTMWILSRTTRTFRWVSRSHFSWCIWILQSFSRAISVKADMKKRTTRSRWRSIPQIRHSSRSCRHSNTKRIAPL